MYSGFFRHSWLDFPESWKLRAAPCQLPPAFLLLPPALPTRAVDPASLFLVLWRYTGKEVVG
jgi:hypothetical protein